MLANRNLRLLVVGQFISAIGDHFYLIAMPWLALQLTGSAFIAGTLLAVASVPRAAFMLLGGAATDRYSAKSLLIGSNGLQAVLMAGLGFAILVPFAELWFLYVIAFSTGLIDAFGLPAFNTLLPGIVGDDELERGNVYLQGANMASGAVGPALAGLLISLAGARLGSGSGLNGLGVTFLINALTFLIGISFFWWIRTSSPVRGNNDPAEPLISSIGAVIEHIRADTQLRNLFALMMVLGLFLTGAIRVGFPLLAESYPSGGVREFGFMSSAFGAGLLAGMIGLRWLPSPPRAISGIVVLSLFAMVPAGLILLGLGLPVRASLAIIAVMGAAFGYVLIYLLSWLQRQTPNHLLGRTMAVVLFSTIGLSPVSQVLMGYLLDMDLQATLIGVGSLVLLLLALTGRNRRMWRLRE